MQCRIQAFRLSKSNEVHLFWGGNRVSSSAPKSTVALQRCLTSPFKMLADRHELHDWLLIAWFIETVGESGRDINLG